MKKTLFVLKIALFTWMLSAGWAPRPALAAAGANNFVIQDYQIDYYLSRDKDNRSVLKTVESITAIFPAADQNHGLERAIPDSYDEHTTNLKIASVTDGSGTAQKYSTSSSGGNTVLRIGDASTYVHGPQTYKITYSQRDVTNYFKDTNDDEFYWDTNGTEWQVPINALTVRLHLAEGLASARTAKQCYVGQAGSTTHCSITSTDEGLVMRTGPLQAYENMTLAIGFQPQTFTPYQPTLAERLVGWWFILLGLTLGLAIVFITWFGIRYYWKSNRGGEINTIVPEYLPPPNASVAVSASIISQPQHTFSAQLIDFAVRHYIKIYQTREKTWFRGASYELEIIKDIASLKAEEQEVFNDIFGSPQVGSRLDMETLKNNQKVGLKLKDNQKKLDKNIAGQYALRARDEDQSAWFKRWGGITLLLAIITFSPWLLAASMVAYICSAVLKPLTDNGLELSHYLKGLQVYIKTAEVERLRMLQSPEGALKLPAPLDTNNQRQLIKLYERVLPYAILFGQEKEWNKRLGQYYAAANESPSWLAGNGAVFNAVTFSAAISSLNSAAAYSDPASSTSGGSGGGGYSGGGGGGGGGGGW